MSYVDDYKTKANGTRYLPKIRVSFHTDTDCYQIETAGVGFGNLSDPTKQLLSVSTSKSLQNPVGMFNMSFAGVAWADKISPNDIVVICMGYIDGENVDTVMVGVIDTISQNVSISGDQPQVITSVSGRDFGKLLIKPALKFYPELRPIGEDGEELTTDELMAKKWFLTEVGWITLLNYFTGIGTNTKGSPAQMLDIIMRKIVTKVIDTQWTAYTETSSVRKKKTLKIGNIMRYQFAKTPFFSLPLYMSLQSYEGSVWNLMERGCPKPFLELFIDTRKREELWNEENKNMIIRDSEIEAYASSEVSFSGESYEKTGFSFGEDDSLVSLTMRNSPFDSEDWNNLYTHTVEIKDVTSQQISISDDEHYNLFWAGVQLNPIGEDLKRVAPPEYVAENIRRFGLSPMEITIESLVIDEATIAFAYPEVTILTKELNKKLKRWYKDNHLYYNGTMEVRGKGSYKVGQRLKREDLGLVFYIEEVSQSFTLFEGWTTNLGLTRGQKY